MAARRAAPHLVLPAATRSAASAYEIGLDEYVGGDDLPADLAGLIGAARHLESVGLRAIVGHHNIVGPGIELEVTEIEH